MTTTTNRPAPPKVSHRPNYEEATLVRCPDTKNFLVVTSCRCDDPDCWYTGSLPENMLYRQNNND